MLLQCFLALVVSLAAVSAQDNPVSYLDTILKSYDNRIRPFYGVKPVDVQVGLYISNFEDVDDFRHSFTVKAEITKIWQDSRLTFPSKYGQQIDVPQAMIASFWQPDVSIVNGISMDSSKELVHLSRMSINQTGHVTYVYSVTQKIACPMYMVKFPMDKHSCPIKFQSYANTAENMTISFLAEAVNIDPDVRLSRFTLGDPTWNNCTDKYYSATPGVFPCQEVVLTFSRMMSLYIIQFYVPSVLLVLIAYIGFWISPTATVERLTLGLLITLILVILSLATRYSMVHVDSIVGVDVWILLNFLYVISTVVEFAVVYLINQHRTDEVVKPRMPTSKVALRVDRFCRVAYPLFFCTEQIILWLVYGSLNV